MKTIVVTGAAGFIASHLTERLLDEGNSIIGIDNLITGNIKNIKHLFANKNFKFIQHDISKPIYFNETIEQIYHLASPASPIDYLEYPIQTLKVGAMGTHIALGIAKKHKAAFLISSTSEVYGDPLVHPQKEDYWGNVNPIGPRGVYDEAKRYAEAITEAYRKYHKLETHIARIFNTYGPRMRPYDGRVVPAFIMQSLTNKSLSVFGNGSQTRSFCYVSDLVEGLFRLMNSNDSGPINLGNPHEMTILEFAQLIIKLTESKSDISYQKLPEDDPKVRQPDITKAKNILKWEPHIFVEEGLKLTIEFFRRNYL
ncbi:SDR family oxidoreductase [bacterium]|nr:SDR family oxidoreductase [bacterium]